jgi:hypothetical protein
LPRLAHLGGNISIDMRPMLERVVAPALTSAGDVNITMRSNDVDLTGLDALEQVGAIRLENLEFQDQATPYVRGLNGVKQAASLLVRGYGARPDPVPTLASLTEVTGSVQIDGYSQTTPPQSINGLDYRPVFGTDAIEIIGGDLKISHPDLEDFSDFSQVHTVVGNLIVSNSPGLSQAEIQSFACGMTNPPQNISCN